MSDLRDAARQALEAWEYINLYGFVLADYEGPMEQAITALKAALEQPEQDVPEISCGNMQWADIPKEFNDWWDADRLTQTNPFREDSPAYWAWEGWQARTALAEPVQEPVAWRWRMRNPTDSPGFAQPWNVTTYYPREQANEIEPLYIAPPRREWRGLSEEEIAQVLGFGDYTARSTEVTLTVIARAVEAALRSKNHD